MKFSEQWLREWVDPPVDTAGLVRQLTSAGLEVDSTEAAIGTIDKVVVARVLETRPHPDADKLTLCRVDAGLEEPLEVVCGAPNARAGLVSPMALVGARLPDGSKIRKSKIRGQISYGMLCSARELGLGEDAGGLLELPDGTQPGLPLGELLGADDVSIDIDLTPNRGDCLCLEGIAREVAAANAQRLEPRKVATVAAVSEAGFAVRLDEPAACPRYVGRVIRDIDVNARTPLWMSERLRRSGVRPLSPVVDVSNYVMLELGNPMHAFDLDRLTDEIQVRYARPGETTELLDGSEVELSPRDLVIADARGAVALAGIMGGMDSAVSATTTNVFLECAWFEPLGISSSARRLGMHTDASHRFERVVNSQGQVRAIERATRLLLDIMGGIPGPLEDHCQPEFLPKTTRIDLRQERIRRLLGKSIAPAEVAQILQWLHIEVADSDSGWQATPPPFRPDISIEADLIEEIARIHGYENFPGVMPTAPLAMRDRPEARRDLAQLKQILVQRGYQEVITYSFVDARLQSRLLPEAVAIPLENPISADMDVMRTSLIPGLVQAALYNLNRQQQRLCLFEAGLIFEATAAQTLQRPMLGAVRYGSRFPKQWGIGEDATDFYDLKGDIEAICGVLPDSERLVCKPLDHPAFHPGQSAEVYRDGQWAGRFGLLHPALANEYKLASGLWLMELFQSALVQVKMPVFQAFSRHPVVRRDIAVVVDEAVSAGELRKCVGQARADMLKKLELFDVYRGEGIDSGRKSMAFTLTFQAPSRTLDDAEVNASVKKILDSLAKHLGATPRV